jgi:hypothetical protein
MSGTKRGRNESINAFGQESLENPSSSKKSNNSDLSDEEAAGVLGSMKGDTKYSDQDREAMVDRVVNIYQAFEDFNRDNGINLSTPSGQKADEILKQTLDKVQISEGAMDIPSGGKKKRRKRGGADCTKKDAAALLTIFMVFIYNRDRLGEFVLSYMPNVFGYVPRETNIRIELLINSISRQITSFLNGLISGVDAAVNWNSTAIIKAVFDAIQNNLTVTALTSLLAYFNIKSITDAATYAKNTVVGVPGTVYEKLSEVLKLLCGYIADARVMVEEAMRSPPPTSGEMATQTEADAAVENNAKLSAQKTKITDFFAAKSSSGGAKKKTRKARKGKKAKKTRKGKKAKKTRRVKKAKKARKTRARKSKK